MSTETFKRVAPALTPEQEKIAQAAKELASTIENHCPKNEEKEHSLNYVDMALLWANASISKK